MTTVTLATKRAIYLHRSGLNGGGREFREFREFREVREVSASMVFP